MYRVNMELIEAYQVDSCEMAKRATSDFNDIAHYVHKWTKNFDHSNQIFKTTEQSALKSVNSSGNAVEQILRSDDFPIEDENNIVNFMGKTETGMDKWIALEKERLDRLNREGISILKKQLNYAYVSKDGKGLKEFLDHNNNAIKKANIAKPEENAFNEMNKELLSILDSKNTLEFISSPADNLLKKIKNLNKRSIC